MMEEPLHKSEESQEPVKVTAEELQESALIKRSKLSTLVEWHGQEAFWQSVYAGTLGGIVSLLLVAGYAVAIGLINVHRLQVANFLTTLAVIGFMFAWLAVHGAVDARTRARGPARPSWADALAEAGAVLGLLLMVVLVNRLAYHWAGY